MKRAWSHSADRSLAVTPSSMNEIGKGQSLSTVGRQFYSLHSGGFHAVAIAFDDSAENSDLDFGQVDFILAFQAICDLET